VLAVDGERRPFRVRRVGDISYVDCSAGSATLTEVPRFAPPRAVRVEGSLVAPIPGAVGRVAVTPGQSVRAGDLLLTLEAMKLEHAVTAPTDGVVTELHVEAGAQVDAGALLATLAATPESAATPTESEDLA
jgi:propionyl-CoA carboxylase alpha chain